MRVTILVAVSMLAFAANSVLARLALGSHAIDPLAYTGIRLTAGAVVLVAIAWSRRPSVSLPRAGLSRAWLGGSWAGALSLALYAVTFSIAYVMVATGPGALILFACVQISMLAWAVFRGDRPSMLEWAGIVLALGALAYLVAPSLIAPPPMGAALMAIAGVSWGAYCLVGRGSQSALADSAGNFARCVPVGLPLIVLGVWHLQPEPAGLVYALISGAVASGLGYIIWYSVLPHLSRTRAAFVQLTVPAIAAAGGVVFIGEAVTLRLVLATAGIIGGVALALAASQRRTAA